MPRSDIVGLFKNISFVSEMYKEPVIKCRLNGYNCNFYKQDPCWDCPNGFNTSKQSKIYKAICVSPHESDKKCEHKQGEECILTGECNWKEIKEIEP